VTKKQKCQKCGKPLSSYNPGPNCFAHTDGNLVYSYKPSSNFVGPEESSSESLVRELEGVICDGELIPIDQILGLPN